MNRTWTRICAGFLLLLGIIATSVAAATPAAAAPAVIVVNTTSNRADANPADGVCRTSRGACSLRAAITTANINTGDDRIEFNISGSGTKTISVGTNPLPDVYDPTGRLTIDGYTQSDAQPNTAAVGSNARIRIQILGPGRGLADYGIRLASAENTVTGLAIAGFDHNVAIHYESADANVIVGNFLGLLANGSSHSETSWNGVHIWLGPDFNRVGGPALADRNVISGSFRGLLIEQGNTSRNTIQNNVIGLNPSLTDRLGQVIGMDVQWGTWGNLIGGPDAAAHGNLISGNYSNSGGGAAVDFSHSTADNLLLNNLIGTLADGNSANSDSANGRGVLIKDNAINMHVEGNVIANSLNDGVWQKHNYNGPSVFLNNRIGVGRDGAALGNEGHGVLINGHDDIFHGNIVANNEESGYTIVDLWENSVHTNFPAEQTLGNQIIQTTVYNNGGSPAIDIDAEDAHNSSGPHRNLAAPNITGVGDGEMYGRAPCANCAVEIYVSGRIRANGTINVGSTNVGTGAGYIGRTTSNGNRWFSLASEHITVGKTVSAVVFHNDGSTSEMGSRVVPSTPTGIRGNPATTLAPVAAPERPDLPSGYVSELPDEFLCSQDAGTLTWGDAGASAYYVFAVTDGVEQYLGGHSTTSLTVPDADSYRVEHWALGGATNATCDFTSGGAVFSCSVSGATLNWGNAGANQYYVFATVGGTEQYLGGHSGTSLTVTAADSYRVEHWAGNGATNAVCDGPGAVVFSCSVAGGTLSWTDVGAPEYYVFATVGGTEQYLGGHAATSLNVTAAESYRVEHWLGNGATNALCS